MSESYEPSLKKLTEEVAKLHSLLQAPEPGLMTWWSMVNNRLVAINNITEQPQPKGTSNE